MQIADTPIFSLKKRPSTHKFIKKVSVFWRDSIQLSFKQSPYSSYLTVAASVGYRVFVLYFVLIGTLCTLGAKDPRSP